MKASAQGQYSPTVEKHQTLSNEEEVKLDSDDNEDCVLVSIDLSKQLRPIARNIHNTKITLDDSETEDDTEIIVKEHLSKEIVIQNQNDNIMMPSQCNMPSKADAAVTPEETPSTFAWTMVKDHCSDSTSTKEELKTCTPSTVNPMSLGIINVTSLQAYASDATSSSFSINETVIDDEPTEHGPTPIIRIPSPGITIGETNVVPLATNLPVLQTASTIVKTPVKITCSQKLTRDSEPFQAGGIQNLPPTNPVPNQTTSLAADFKLPILHNNLPVRLESVFSNTETSELLHATGGLPATNDMELVIPHVKNISVKTDKFFPCEGQEYLTHSGGGSSQIHQQPASSQDTNMEFALNCCDGTNSKNEGFTTNRKSRKTEDCLICQKQFVCHQELIRHSESHNTCGPPKPHDDQSVEVAVKNVIRAEKNHICVTCGKAFTKSSYLRKHLKRNSCHLQPLGKRHAVKLKLIPQNLSSSLNECKSFTSEFHDSYQNSAPVPQTHKATDLCSEKKAETVSVIKNVKEIIEQRHSNMLLGLHQHCALCMELMTSVDLEKHTEIIKSCRFSNTIIFEDVENECSFCSEKFASKCELIGHLLQTPQCEENFNAIFVTDSPKYEQATTGSDTYVTASANSVVQRFSHSCDNYGAMFIDSKKLKGQQESCECRPNKSESVHAYNCLVCGRFFQTFSERTNHMLCDSKCQLVIEVQCLKCGREFEFPDLKREHLKEQKECATFEENGFSDIQPVAVKRQEASELYKDIARSVCHSSSLFVTKSLSAVASSRQTAHTVSSKADLAPFRISGSKDTPVSDSPVFTTATREMLSDQPPNAESSHLEISVTKDSSFPPTVKGATSSTLVARCNTCSIWFPSYALLQQHFKQQICKKIGKKETAPGTEKGKTYPGLITDSPKTPNILCCTCQQRFATHSMLKRHFSDSLKCKLIAGEDRQDIRTGKKVNSESDNNSVSSYQNNCAESFMQNITKSTDGEKCFQRACSDKSETVPSGKKYDGLNTYKRKETKGCEDKIKKKTSKLRAPFKRNEHELSSKDDIPSQKFVLKKAKIVLDDVSVMCRSCKRGLKDDLALAAHLEQSESCSNGCDNSITTVFPFESSVCNKKFISDKLSSSWQGSKNCLRNFDEDVYEKSFPENLKTTSSSFEITPVDNASASPKKQDLRIKEPVISDSESTSCCSSSRSSNNSSSSSELEESVSDVEFKCKLCDKQFHVMHSLRKHMKKHKGYQQPQLIMKNKIRCRACKRRLENSTALQAHLIQDRFCFITQAQKQWRKEYAQSKSCCSCGKTFSSFKSLRKHCYKDMTCRLRYINSILEGCEKRDHKSIVESTSSNKTDESQTVKKRNTDITVKEISHAHVSGKQFPCFCCKNCVKTFKSKRTFSLHFRNNKDCRRFYHNPAQNCPVDIFDCSHCDRYFNSSHHKNEHVCARLCKKAVVCQFCPYKFSNTKALSSNLHRKHKKNLQKISCVEMIRNKAKLKTVSKKVKELDKSEGSGIASEVNAQLNLCSSFTQKINHSCVECEQTFSNNDLFVSHVASHQRVVPKVKEGHKNLEEPGKDMYICYICKQAFDKLEKLKFHYEKSKCGEYKCNFCSLQFKSETALKQHKCQCERRIGCKADSAETKVSHVQFYVRQHETTSDSANTDLLFKSVHKNTCERLRNDQQVISCNDSLQKALSPEKNKVLCILCNKTIVKGNSINHFNYHQKTMFKVLSSKSSKPPTSFSKEKCPICFKMFLSRNTLKQHYLLHTSKDIIIQVGPPSGHSSSDDPSLPDQSNESTDSKTSFSIITPGDSTLSQGTEKPKNKNLSSTDAPAAAEFKPSVAARTECPVCKRLFNDTSALKFHAKQTHPFESRSLFSSRKINNAGNTKDSNLVVTGSCKLCHKKITNITHFHEHIENSHPKRKLLNYMQFFKPNIDSSFTQKENLKQLSVKPVGTCKMCHKKFDTTQVFYDHVKTSHPKRSLINYMRFFKPNEDMSS